MRNKSTTSTHRITDDSEVKASADALKLVSTTSGDRAPADQQTDMIEGTFKGRIDYVGTMENK